MLHLPTRTCCLFAQALLLLLLHGADSKAHVVVEMSSQSRSFANADFGMGKKQDRATGVVSEESIGKGPSKYTYDDSDNSPTDSGFRSARKKKWNPHKFDYSFDSNSSVSSQLPFRRG